MALFYDEFAIKNQEYLNDKGCDQEILMANNILENRYNIQTEQRQRFLQKMVQMAETNNWQNKQMLYLKKLYLEQHKSEVLRPIDTELEDDPNTKKSMEMLEGRPKASLNVHETNRKKVSDINMSVYVQESQNEIKAEVFEK